jgi:cytochrome b
LLFISVTTAFLTEDFELLHEITGYLAIFLVIIRLIYGIFTKNRYAKLSEFFHSSDEVFNFIISIFKFKEKRYLGHNPLAGLTMFFMLFMILASGISGILGYSMKEEEGFASQFITANFELGEKMLHMHEVTSNVLLFLIIFHLIGVLVSSILTSENLAKIIFFTGKKRED